MKRRTPPCIEQGCDNDRCGSETGYALRCAWCLARHGAPVIVVKEPKPETAFVDRDAIEGRALAHA